MRAIAALGLAVLALSAAAAAAGPVPVLTLEGPKATQFGHTVDLVGRLTPASPGSRVELRRGSLFIAATALRGDGTYHFTVSLGRPGPFRTVARGVSSKPLTVQIHPQLMAELDGERLAGEPLTITARLIPREAGRVRVRVVRDGEDAYRGVFAGEARVRLGTVSLDPFHVAVETLPRAGYASVSRDVRISLRAPSLGYGARSPFVTELLRRLEALDYVTPSARSLFDGDVLQSVYAFQKAERLDRTGVADAAFWHRLAKAAPLSPRYDQPASHIEVDKQRQILLVVRDGRVALVSPISTAGIAGYHTPEGRFAISRKIPGYDTSPLGVLYKPMYFYGGYAIHGNPSVPPYPASHGCIRVPNFVIDRLYATEPYGETVIVY